MRILLDLQGAQSTSRFRGIGRYSLSLALAMARNAGEHEIWIALNGAFPESIFSIRHAFAGLVPPERIRIFEVPVPLMECDSSNSWRVRASEIIREHFLEQLKPDVVHVSSLFEGYKDNAVTSVGVFASMLPTSVTLYDLIPFLHQKEYLSSKSQRDSYLRKMESLKKADLLLAISEASRQEAIEVLQVPQNRVINISAAANERFCPFSLTIERIHQIRSNYGLVRKMVMYAPGGFDWRKNFEGLITAYSMLCPALRADHQLVIVGDLDQGARSRLEKLAKEACLAKDELVITGYVRDSELIEFYNLARLFVFPSTHEGFGLPVLEAMACGAPVIASNVTSIPEVIGLPEALFDPFSPEDITKKMTQVLTNDSVRETFRAHGLSQAKRFTWDDCAKRVISGFEMLVQTRAGVSSSKKIPTTSHELVQSIAEINISSEPTESDLVRVAECIGFNTGHGEHKQLLLDISVIVHGDAKSGIQRVVRSLLRELIEDPPSGFAVRPIYFDGIRYKYASAFTAAFVKRSTEDCADKIVEFCQDDIYLALDLNAHLTGAVHDLHLNLQRRGVALYFIVYDLLLLQHPEWWPAGTNLIFDAWMRSISEVATGLICISDAVAEEVRGWLDNNPPTRIERPSVNSFHLGADIENSIPSKGMPDEGQTILGALYLRPSFLMVGTVEPRKGHAQALAALELLWAQDIDANFVIVGKQGWLVEKLVDKLKQHPELNKRLFWLEGISDEFLEKVYNASTCLIVASKGEGFGLPLIEAAKHKTPIIARDLPVFREVAGDHAFYFTGYTPEELAAAIIKWFILRQRNAHPKSQEMHYLSWRESALHLKDLLVSTGASSLQRSFSYAASHIEVKLSGCRKKIIWVDISDLVQKDLQTGIQRVTRSILTALTINPLEGYLVEPVYATASTLGYYHARRYTQQIAGLIVDDQLDDPIDPKPGDIFLGLDFVAGIVTAQQQYLKWVRAHGVSIYFVVYDLLPIKIPRAFQAGVDEGHRQWLKVITGFDGAICISRTVKSDLEIWLKENGLSQVRSYRTGWFHLGSDLQSSIPSKGIPDFAEVVLRQLALRPSFLMVGTIEPRKGHAQTLAAFEQLWADKIDANLVVVGKVGWFTDELIQKLRCHSELNKRLFWLDGISDEFLEKVYAVCTCLLATSEDEGFGLPLIEAAQHKIAIIARGIPIFREVAGEHAFYFEGFESKDLADAITEWLKLQGKSKYPRSENMQFLTWQESAQQLVDQLTKWCQDIENTNHSKRWGKSN